MKIVKLSSIVMASSLSVLCLSACPTTPPIYPKPTETPFFEPTPYAPTPTSVPTPEIELSESPSPDSSGLLGSGVKPLPPLTVIEAENGNLYSDSFKLEFGPGSKNVALEFGPGSKPVSLEFGPGSKGPQNLKFNLGFPKVLTNPALQPFSVQQLAIGGALFSQLSLEIIRDNQLYATATALPRRESMQIPARFHPGVYTISVVAQTRNGPLQMSWNQIEILPEFNAELKVSVFGTETSLPEDLDIEVLGRNHILREE